MPGNLVGMLGLESPAYDVGLSSMPTSGAGPAAASTDAPKETAGTRASSSIPDLPITKLAEIALLERTSAGDWDVDRRRDIEAAVKLFVAANGDIGFSTIEQQHIARTVALFPRPPTRYGFFKLDPATGARSQESIQEALERGAELLRQWADPVAAEAAKVPTVGLGAVIQKKHLTWLRALVAFAEENGRPYPTKLNFGLLRRQVGATKVTRRSAGKRKNQALLAWAVEDLQRAFTAPIWSGCACLWRRFEVGETIFHDAWYWVPLIHALTGYRSDEGAGLAVNDIYDEATVPYVHFRVNAFRRIKTAASDRKVPLHPELIRLGFLDYVRAMRSNGHAVLFPDLHHEKLSFDHNFYDKVFEPLRASMFPNGTSRKQARKDVDVRSIRSRCITHLDDVGCPKPLAQAIVGHEVGDVTSDIYRDDPDLALLLPRGDAARRSAARIARLPAQLASGGVAEVRCSTR